MAQVRKWAERSFTADLLWLPVLCAVDLTAVPLAVVSSPGEVGLPPASAPKSLSSSPQAGLSPGPTQLM